MLVQAAHIADGVERGGDPQHRGHRREDEPETIDPKEHGNVGENLPDVELNHVTRQHERDHREDHARLHDAREEGEDFAQVLPALSRPSDADYRNQGCNHSNERAHVVNHCRLGYHVSGPFLSAG